MTRRSRCFIVRWIWESRSWTQQTFMENPSAKSAKPSRGAAAKWCSRRNSASSVPLAHVIEGHHIADSVRMLVVPGSARVRRQAESEGLDVIFKEAGAEWRAAGCSMCLGMNPDQLAPGERAASTSNRNFEGRQGKGGRTHLVSPPVAAATAILGRLGAPTDLADLTSTAR